MTAITRTEDPIIQVSNISKQYNIGMDRTYKTFSESFTNAIRSPIKSLQSIGYQHDTFWALKNINFNVNRGEVVGIIGRNGAGKSTLLKILSRITSPTEGEIRLNGRVGSLLEVGTGFHPELTGRENIYFNGAILGMKKNEIDDKFDEIVKFSGVEKFLDTPVKRYSSGMQVRLAFSVAANLDPEILVVDEVLAVGDAQFQKKCLGKMGEVAEGGRTVLFVSHNMSAVKALCDRGLLIEDGKIDFDNEISEVIERYIGGNDRIQSEINRRINLIHHPRDKNYSRIAQLVSIELKNGDYANTVDGQKPFEIIINIDSKKDFEVSCQISIQNSLNQNILLFSSELQKRQLFELTTGLNTIICHIEPTLLTSGKYTIACGIAIGPHEWIDLIFNAISFEISDFDRYHTGFNYSQKYGIYHVDHCWEFSHKINLGEYCHDSG